MRINKHDTQGTKPLLSKGELGYDDYTAGGDTGRVYVGTGVENIALAERLESNMMTKAQFNALADERKANRAGSGFDEFGSNHSISSGNVNKGIFTPSGADAVPNQIWLSVEDATSQKTPDGYPFAIIGGVRQKLKSIGANYNKIQLPTAPNIYPHDTVLTPEQIASGVIKHADASNSGLIVNGKFDTDTSGWAKAPNYDSTAVINNGKLRVTATGPYGRYLQPIPTIVGKTYIVNGEATLISGGGFASISLTNSGGPDIIVNVKTFVATTSTSYISCSLTSTGAIGEFDNIAVYPADAISRSELVFPESYHEDIAEKGVGYPFGNVQYLGGNTDGLTGIANGAFTGFEQYSLFGNWQTPSSLIGKGYVWSSLTEAQKRAFIANPENNCYLDGDKTIQVRYRVRVVQGVSDVINPFTKTGNASYLSLIENGASSAFLINAKGKRTNSEETKTFANRSTSGTYGYAGGSDTVLGVATVAGDLVSNTTFGTPTDIAYEGKCYAIPLALVHRRNQGMYHNVYNPNGTKLASDGLDCFRTTISFTSTMDCFDPAKLLTASGYIGTVSGRPDGLFYDQVHESDITDLRNSSKKVEDYNRLISREFNKLVAGATRGFEGEKYTEITTQTTTGTVATVQVKDGTRYKRGDVIYIYDLTASSVKGRFVVVSISTNTLTVDTAFAKLANSYMISGASSTRTKSNTLLVCDVIGNPASYPTIWKTNEVAFTTLHTAEDGTSLLPDGTRDTFKLSRDANATPLLCLRSIDNGATWASFTPTFSTTTNAITLTDEPAGNIVLVYYQTKTTMATPTVNSEVLELGEVWAGNSQYTTSGGAIVGTLLNKVSTGSLVPVALFNGKITGFKFFNAPIDKLDIVSEYKPAHSNIPSLGTTASPAVKVFPYLTRLNGKAYLNLVFKEMKHNGTSWGDDAKFNIVDSVSTTTDNNAQTVLIGQKTVELPYFIGAEE